MQCSGTDINEKTSDSQASVDSFVPTTVRQRTALRWTWHNKSVHQPRDILAALRYTSRIVNTSSSAKVVETIRPALRHSRDWSADLHETRSTERHDLHRLQRHLRSQCLQAPSKCLRSRSNQSPVFVSGTTAAICMNANVHTSHIAMHLVDRSRQPSPSASGRQAPKHRPADMQNRTVIV
jgi:hypothetical protein